MESNGEGHGKKKNWVVYVPEFRTPVEPQREILDPITEIVTDKAKDEAALISLLGNVDAALLTLATRMTRTVIEACPHLKVISKYGVGFESIDVEAATDVGIPVTNTPGVNTHATAELAIGLSLALIRKIQGAKEHIKGGGWKGDMSAGVEFNGSTFGIIGYGKIAKQVIRILQGFGVQKVLVFSESRAHETPEFPNVSFVHLERLLKESDIVSIHKSLTPSSQGLLGESELRLMKPTAYLINTARGSLVQESALIKALGKGWIAGAALDVFEKEPLDPNNSLLSMDNVVLTPHVGGITTNARLKMVTVAAKNVADILNGGRPDPQNVVNPEVFRGQA